MPIQPWPFEGPSQRTRRTGFARLHRSARTPGRQACRCSPWPLLASVQSPRIALASVNKLEIENHKAQELIARFSPEYIEEKVEFLEWKLKTRSRGRPIQDPAAWLIRAIERDYIPRSAVQSRQEIAQGKQSATRGFRTSGKNRSRKRKGSASRGTQTHVRDNSEGT